MFLLVTLVAACSNKPTQTAPEENLGQAQAALNANEQTAYEYFVAKGLTNFQSAGIVGNLIQESNVNPNAIQFGGPGRGIAQWSTGGRWDSTPNANAYWLAGVEGKDVWSLDLQLDFIWWELTNEGYGFNELRASTDVAGATIAFEDYYEICGNCQEAQRIGYAQDVLNAWGATPPPMCDGQTRPCGSNVGECRQGVETCSGPVTAEVWGPCVGAIGPTPEVCDGKDNDCDGLVDNHDVCELDQSDEAARFDLAPSTDVDGDGRADAGALSADGITVSLATGEGFGAPLPTVPVDGVSKRSIYTTLRFGDLDGDGRADACVRQTDGIHCWLSNGHGFEQALPGPPLSDANGWDSPNASTIRLADVDGDGRADLCARGPDGFACYRSTGNGFEPLSVLDALSDAAGFGNVNRFATIRMGDVNGDGLADVCARGVDGVSCWLSDGHGFPTKIAGPPWSDANGFGAWERWATIRIADVDGDGRADLCAREDAGFRCYLSDGHGFSTQIRGPVMADAATSTPIATSIRMGDIDGDGAADLCYRGASGIACWLSTKHGFGDQLLGPAWTDAGGWGEPARFRTLRFADVNGDDRLDLCARGPNGIECWLGAPGGFGDHITGPAWSDDAGWNEAPRFTSIELTGRPARATPNGPLGPPATPPNHAAGSASSCSCRVNGTPEGGGAWLLVFAGAMVSLVRRKGSSWV